TPAEAILAAIFAEALGLERVGIHGNFFALGGDSILSIQVVSRARRNGVMITPHLVFQHQTIAALAAAAERQGEATGKAETAEQGAISGEVALTPIQRWFFELRPPNPHHWNQSVLLAPRHALDPGILEQALWHVIGHHDASRLRFVETKEGWRQHHIAAGPHVSQPGGELLRRVDLRSVPAAAREEALAAAASALQASLHITAGPLLRAAWFDLGGSQRLLIVAHHLAVDGVSWRVLLEDVESACRQLAADPGRPPSLPPKTTSFKRWAERLWDYAGARLGPEEAAYWSDPARLEAPPLPVDDAGGSNAVALTQVAVGALDVAETIGLLRDAPAAYRTEINDILLTALVLALRAWSGSATALVNLEGHGREELFPDVDLSRTVGWFTSLFPVLLRVRPEASAGEALKGVKEQLRAIPGKGIGYGLLRYGDPESPIAARLRAQQAPISFNYLGQFDQSLPEGALFSAAGESAGQEQDGRGMRAHDLDFSGIVLAGRLQLTLNYSGARYRRASAERLMAAYLEALRGLIAHCLSPEEGGYAPSDFPLARLSQERLDAALGGQRGIEDLYPLTPLQQGILFHALYAPGSGVYVEQLGCALRGALEPAAFAAAWRRVAAAHPILRSSFLWEGLEAPLQAVHAKAEPPLIEEDWRGLTEAEQARRWEAYREADRRAGFDFAAPPLMRLALMRCGEDKWLFLWSHHHILLDGWSVALVLGQVFSAYQSLRQGKASLRPAPRPYRDYLIWLANQDRQAAEAYWRGTLAGFATPTSLGAAAPAERPDPVYAEQTRVLPSALTAAMEAFARQHQLTVNTLAQGAWALLLSRISGEQDIL
ncbi:condensation domain-containing protein, partial [Methylocapsa aurea]|uniref:condensation domain-containing protein n=1 Tax=Methylocapsa aurea TaxID=663610 RepID=UPI000568A316